MKKDAKEKVYLLIIIFCTVMCGAMMVTMLTGGKSNVVDTHTPAIDEGVEDVVDNVVNDSVKEITDNTEDLSVDKPAENEKVDGDIQTHQPADQTNEKVAITEEYVNKRLDGLFPESFPVNNPTVDIGADGIITLTGKVNRDELKTYLNNLGVDIGLKYSVALLMMPREIDAEVALTLNEGNDGKMYAKLKSASLSQTQVPISLFPKKVSDVISNAVNGLITEVDGTFDFYGFEDGAILFNKV